MAPGSMASKNDPMSGVPRFPRDHIPHPGGTQPSELRVSDTERDRVVELLQNAFSEGRLDDDELNERMDAAFASKTRGELAVVLRGLPVTSSPGAPTPPPAYAAPQAKPTSLERSWAMAAHWSGLFTMFIGPLVIAAAKGGDSRYIHQQAWEATNFQLTFLGANIAIGFVAAVTFGLGALAFPLLWLTWFALLAVGGLSAAAGNTFRYPWILRLFGRGNS